MQIYYWCPFLTKIATIDAVKNSAIALGKYSNNSQNLTVKILNSFGEWNFLKNNNLNINIHEMQKINLHKFFPKQGLFSSRFTFITIFILNFFPLLKLIKKHKPDYIIIHLLTILPIILSPFISKHTKIILRISGLPEMHFFRKFLWKFFSKYIFLVTTPTNLTKILLEKNEIFETDKVKLLRDPIINSKTINVLKKKEIDISHIENQFYLAIGRLTGQKNFGFLINAFAKNINKFRIKKLLIIGEGEEFENLNKLILENNAQNNIYLLGFRENVYSYIKKSSAIISCALYEDPGFALIEASYMRKKIISSLVSNGPIEMHNHSNMGYFFESNNVDDFVEKIVFSENDPNSKVKIKNALMFAKNFSLYSHFKNLNNLI